MLQFSVLGLEEEVEEEEEEEVSATLKSQSPTRKRTLTAYDIIRRPPWKLHLPGIRVVAAFALAADR